MESSEHGVGERGDHRRDGRLYNLLGDEPVPVFASIGTSADQPGWPIELDWAWLVGPVVIVSGPVAGQGGDGLEWGVRTRGDVERRRVRGCPLYRGRPAVVPLCWYHRWYHTSMDKTTVYLPVELKTALRRLARERGVSEAEVIRESIRRAVSSERPQPSPGLYASGTPIAREADAHLRGFGER